MSRYCEFPWILYGTKLFNNTQLYCCKVVSLPEPHHSRRLLKVKESFLSDQEHSDCKSCWKDEDMGGTSFRLFQFKEIPTKEKIIWLSKKENDNLPIIELIDVEFGYTCNMYCMSCGPHASSTWQQMKNIFPYTENSNLEKRSLEALIEKIQFNKSSLRKINFFGGEPSVDPLYYKFIEAISDINLNENCEIRIVTNGNYSDNFRIKFEKSIFDLRKKNKKIEVRFSIDAAGEEGEFIRGGLDNKKFLKNIKAMSNFDVTVYIQTSISILNVEIFTKIYTWLDTEEVLKNVNIHFNKVSVPWDLSINSLGNKILNFLPVWPNKFLPIKYEFDKFLGSLPHRDTSPDKVSLKKFVKRFEEYQLICKKPIPMYYINLIDKIKKIINE